MYRSIAFVAPPGGGKGSQALELQQQYPGRFFLASTGDILRDEREHPRIITYQRREDKAVLFPDEDMVQVLHDWLGRKVQQGVYLPQLQTIIKDGFPRTVPQVRLAVERFDWHALFFFSNVDEELSVERVLGRKEKARAAGTIVRDDDNEHDVRRRYRVFMDLTLPLVDEARRYGVPVYEIDAGRGRTIAAVSDDLQAIIERDPFYCLSMALENRS